MKENRKNIIKTDAVKAASMITLVSGLCLFGVLDSWCQVLQSEDSISVHAAEDAADGMENETDETPADSIQDTVASDVGYVKDVCEEAIDAAVDDSATADPEKMSGNAAGNSGFLDKPTGSETSTGGRPAADKPVSGNSGSSDKPTGNKPATTTGSSNNPTHTHSYKPIYKTVHHDAVTHTEQVQVGSDPIYQTVSHVVCRGCGQQDPSAEHLNRHMENGENATTYTTYEDVITGYTPVYENRTIVEKAAYDEQVKEYEICSCGARR